MTTAALRLVLLWAVAATPLLVWLGAYEMFEQPKQLAIKAAAAAAAGLIALAPAPVAPAAVAWPLAAVLLLGLAAAIASPLPLTGFFGEYASYQGWLHWAALAALAWALAAVLRPHGAPRRFLAAAVCGCAVVALYALLQLGGLDPVPWVVAGPVLRTFSTAGNPLYLGCLLAVAVPLSLGLAAGAPTPAARAGKLGMTGLLVAGLVSSGSRGALAAAAAGAAVFAMLARRSLPPRLLRHAAVAGGAALLACAVLVPADRNPFPLLVRRLAAMGRGEDGRPQIWLGALRLLRDRPLAGWGEDAFATVFPRVQTPALWTFLWRGTPEKAHNDLLQMLATVGIPGCGALLWLAAVLARLAARVRGPVGAGAAGGLVAYGVASLIAFATCGPQVLALLCAATLAAGAGFRPVPRVVPAVAGAVLGLSLLAHLQFATSEVALKAALRAGGAGLDRALALRTPWAQRLLRAGDSLEHAALGDSLAGPGPQAAARTLADLTRLYTEAEALNPLHPFGHSDLGRLLARQGRVDEALAEYDTARRLAPLDAYLALEEAQAMLGAGRDAAARALLEGVIARYPAFAEPYGLVGYSWLTRRDWARALPWLERAVTLDWHGNAAGGAAAAGNLAATYHRLGRESDAMRAAEQARTFVPAVP